MILIKSQKRTLLVVGILFLALVFFTYLYKKNINENLSYTVGYVYDYQSVVSSGPFISYYYYVNNTKYEGSDYYNHDYSPNVGDFFKVKYSFENPSFSELIQSKKITDTALILTAGLTLPKPTRNQFKDD